ncbi:MAG: diguanylate cyclase [Candidatus Aminicenantes bacterium]|jgi:diguanylate cyclase (GGDEF)-like protein
MTPMDTTTNILLVDDKKENLLALEAILKTPGLNISTALSGNSALGLMLEHDFAVVILDVRMPEMDGFEVAELMRKSEKTKFIPIIFVTAFSTDENYIFKGYETGAVDYLFKPLDPVILKSKVNIFLELDKNKKELEESKRKIEKQNERLKELSITDGLTGLYNHRHFQNMLKREFAMVRRSSSDLSCFMIDLDYFKDVNDTFGHTFGDFVLQRFARLLKDAVRETDILARYGGEEFALLLPHTSLEGALVLAEKFRKKAETSVYESDGHSKRVTASVGVASYRTHHPSASSDLVTFADQALYRAKAEGRNQVRFYNQEAVARSGTLNSSPDGCLSDLKKKLKKILGKTKENTVASLELLIRELNSEQSQSNNQEQNQRTLEILDLMSDRLGLPRSLQQTFKRAARLHDLLKMLKGAEPTLKKGTANQEEHMDIQDYLIILEELTQMFDIFSRERIILRHQKENYDGSGYPEGLPGDQLPMGSRLFSLVDAFVTMTDKGSDKPLLTAEQVIDEIVKESGHQFDPLLVNHLLDLIQEKKLLDLPKELVEAAKKKI